MQQLGASETDREVERLRALGAAESTSAGFAALAEAHRRGGRLEEALHVAEAGLREQPEHTAGRVALALALLDLGRLDEARAELMQVLASVPDHPLARRAAAGVAEAAEDAAEDAAAPFSALDEAELEVAFEAAEADPEEMVDANRLAEAALRSVESEAAEPWGGRASSEPLFATETVAELLDRQGHGDEARVVRERIGRRAGEVRAHEASRTDDRTRVLATLERWLDNLRRGNR